MRKIIYLLVVILMTGCAQLQLVVPVASTVTFISVTKGQISDDQATMHGSNVDDIEKGDEDAGDVKVPPMAEPPEDTLKGVQDESEDNVEKD